VFGDAHLLPWLEELTAAAGGVELFDAHTHIGQNDPDGFSATPRELEDSLAAAGARGVVFPMHEPGGYPAANDTVIDAARKSAGRLVPFCRLDPRADPLAEARRALDAGAAGIKLHPRAEAFALDDPDMREVFELADERGLPILVHAGRGIPALGRHAVRICERHPRLQLILAHAGICDLAWIWRGVEELPNLFFDTAWWSPSDLLALYALVPPRHIVFASDAPYSSPTFAAVANLRCALQAGLSPEALRLVFGGQIARLAAGEAAADAGPAPGPGALDRDPLLDRVHTFLVSAIGQMFCGTDPVEQLQLAALACDVGEDAPRAATCATVLELLGLRAQQVAEGVDDGRPERYAIGLPLIVLAACVARTPDAGPR
jgi:predicted TIM-barrel fold metal-dependent hydrolase